MSLSAAPRGPAQAGRASGTRSEMMRISSSMTDAATWYLTQNWNTRSPLRAQPGWDVSLHVPISLHEARSCTHT